MASPLPLLLLAAAYAGPFTPRSSQGDWVQRQVAREVVLPKGWLQLGLALDSKVSGAAREGDGALRRYEDGTRWHYSRLWLEVDQGFSRRTSLYARIPLVHAWLHGEDGLDTSTLALGDVHTGLRFQPWLERRGALALQLDLKAPSGVEWPGDFIGGTSNTTGFLTGTGITNLGLLLHGRWRFGETAALRGRLGYVRKFPAIVGYVIEDDGFGNGWLDPGDEWLVALELQVQLDAAWALAAEGTWSHRGVYQLGVSGEDATTLLLDPIPGSAGDFLDLGLRASWAPSAHWEAGAGLSWQALGSDTSLFAQLGLEEFSPQPGVTGALSGAYRW